jgi:hypothetical protein
VPEEAANAGPALRCRGPRQERLDDAYPPAAPIAHLVTCGSEAPRTGNVEAAVLRGEASFLAIDVLAR